MDIKRFSAMLEKPPAYEDEHARSLERKDYEPEYCQKSLARPDAAIEKHLGVILIVEDIPALGLLLGELYF